MEYVPCIENGKSMYCQFFPDESAVFRGKDKKQAMQMAKELAEKYEAELEMRGF